jgi:PAS domain S-box-containing protein
MSTPAKGGEGGGRPRPDATRQAQAFRSLLAAMVKGASLVEVCTMAAEWAMEFLSASGASVSEVQGDDFTYLAAVGSVAHIVGERIPLENSFTGAVIDQREARIFTPGDSDLGSRERAQQHGVASGIVAPVLMHDRAVGTIGVVSTLHEGFDDEHLAVMRALADYISLGLDRVASRRDFRRLMEQMPEGVAIHQDGRLVFVNQILAAMLGYTKPSTLHDRVFLDFVHLEDRQVVGVWLDSSSSDDGILDARMVRRDGEIALVELTATRHVRFEETSSTLLIVRDVTARRQMQVQLVQADRLLCVGTLAASLIHDISGPLSAVQANLQVALEEAADLRAYLEGDPEAARLIDEQRAPLEDALEAATGLSSFIGKVRRLAHVAPGEADQADVRALLEAAVPLALGNHKHDVEVELVACAAPPVAANEGRLLQVLLNLLMNAVHAVFGREDGVRRIRVSCRRAGAHVIVAVEDSGVGIDPEHLGMIFDPFFTTKDADTGTGIGLAICKSIIESCGGRIEVTSAPGHGSCFRLVLPISPEHL